MNCYTEKLPERADIITLVQIYKDLSFFKAILLICEICGYEYYSDHEHVEAELDPCVDFINAIQPSNKKEHNVKLIKLNESILNSYVMTPHYAFLEEGISFETQKLFEIGYSVHDEAIIIPIRDEIGSLVGIKARTTKDYEALNMSKYWYPFAVPKSYLLYGLDKTYKHIKEAGSVIVFEAEKSVMKAFGYGIKNCVSIGGHEISDAQAKKLERLGVEIIIAMDNNITPKEIKEESKKFILRDNLYSILARKNKGILKEKDAPVDRGKEFFEKLLREDRYKIPV